MLYFKIVNYETMSYNILKGMVCHFVSELFKCLWPTVVNENASAYLKWFE